MSPFKKKCMVLSSSQQIYRSLYLNPLSDNSSSSSSSSNSFEENHSNHHRDHQKRFTSCTPRPPPLLLYPPTPTHPSHVWDDPDTESAPASAWSTLGNRSLLCRPLPLDVGRCTCYITRERQDGLTTVYSLYTDEGQGRQDRKLAIARHRRRVGRSEFVIHAIAAEIGPSKSDVILGRMQANLVGSRYSIWDEANSPASQSTRYRQLLGVVTFEPTITHLTGNFRVMQVAIPKYQSMQITSSNQQHERNGMARNWEENLKNVHQLYSRRPYYNKMTRCYEMDFRDRAKKSCRIKTSTKNVQLIMEESGKQSILLLGKIAKSRYVIEYRFPLTGYQAFSIALASLDSKLCCSI